MRRMATWCPMQKGRAELILSPLSQDEMLGTLSHPTVRAAAASAVQNMQLGASVLWALAVLSSPASLQSWLAQQAKCHTCRLTASLKRPTSRACTTEVSSETHDVPLSATKGPMTYVSWMASLSPSPPIYSCCCISLFYRSVGGGQLLIRRRGWFNFQINQSNIQLSNNN